MDALVVRDLSKNYGDVVALEKVNFSVKEGEIFGLIGPNGAGKTTALRIISTLLTIGGGEVKVFGRDVATEPNEVRKIISYLPEDAGAYKNLTGLAYLEFIASFFAEGEERREMIDYGVEIADLGERINSKVETYSKGMMRRLLIARAIMPRPRFAILDEVTSGLDVVNAFEIREIIRRMSREGVSVLLSSHNMFEVETLCDRIALINEGRLVLEGSPAELMRSYDARNVEEVFTKAVGV